MRKPLDWWLEYHLDGAQNKGFRFQGIKKRPRFSEHLWRQCTGNVVVLHNLVQMQVEFSQQYQRIPADVSMTKASCITLSGMRIKIIRSTTDPSNYQRGNPTYPLPY